jgi:amino acid transporter
MAQDGLLFKMFGRLHPKTLAPLWGTIVTGVVAAIITFFLTLDSLSNMISIGTLMAFTTVCAGIVILRYQSPWQIIRSKRAAATGALPQQPAAAQPGADPLLAGYEGRDATLVNGNGVHSGDSVSAPDVAPSVLELLWHSSVFWLLLYLMPVTCFAASLRHLSDWPLGVVIFLGLLSLVPVVRLALLPVDHDNLPDHTRQFICPLVPWLPCMGMFTNIYLIASLDYMSYVRIVVWTAAGFAIYFGYGIVHSKLAPRVLYAQIKEESQKEAEPAM